MNQLVNSRLWVAMVLFTVLHLNAQTQGGTTENISCTTLDGWVMKFSRDGSASISYGSLPTDQARVAVGVIDLKFVHDSIRPHLKDSSSLNKRVAVNIFKSGQISSIATYADDLSPFQLLCRKVIQNASFIDIARFRGLLEKHPPFGIEEVVINNDQANKLQPKILVHADANSAPPQRENPTVETTPTPPPPLMVQPPAPKKALESKPMAPSPSEEPTSATPRSIIVVLIVAAGGLLWLLVKKRK